jgi:hypothetical protein
MNELIIEPKKIAEKPRIFQPNLTCKYHLTSAPDNRVRSLTVINHDGLGICDEQIVSSFYKWTKECTKNLKLSKIKPPEEIPDMQVFLTVNKEASVFTVIVVSEDPKTTVSDWALVAALSNFAFGTWQALGKDLKELENV